MPVPREIFLSHASQDASKASEMADELRRHGLPVWFAPAQVAGSQPWQDAIGEALRRCDWFVLLLTPHSVESMWVKRELQYALYHRRFEGCITPVRLAACDVERLSWVLESSILSVDLTQGSAVAWNNLFRTWGIGYQGPLDGG